MDSSCSVDYGFERYCFERNPVTARASSIRRECPCRQHSQQAQRQSGTGDQKTRRSCAHRSEPRPLISICMVRLRGNPPMNPSGELPPILGGSSMRRSSSAMRQFAR